MAVLIACATGVSSSASTWALVNQATAAYLDSEAASSNLTTSYTYTQLFAPGAITIDGVAVKIASRTAAGLGTITLELYNDTLAAAVTSVVLDVVDLADAQSNGGWVFFKFASSQLLLVANNYKVGLRVSTGSSVTVYRDSTASNHCRMLRTTTTQALASGDQFHVLGEHTGAGTGNNFTVTWDNTAGTSYGPTVSGGPPQGATVGSRGTLVAQTTASTAYTMKIKGVLGVFGSGVFQIGTSGTPMPTTSSFTYTFDVVANVDSGILIGRMATFRVYGKTISVPWALLAADAAASATSLTSNVSTGWLNGDRIALALTSKTFAHSEDKALTANASGTTLTISALAQAHTGTVNANYDIRGELCNLTRNVVFQGTSATLQGYILTETTSIVDVNYAGFTMMGSATTDKRGFGVKNTTGACNIHGCAFYDSTVASSLGLLVNGSSGNGITITYNVFYNLASDGISNTSTSGVNTFDSNVAVKTSGFTLGDAGSTYTNNRAAGGTNGFSVSEVGAFGTFSGNVSHGNNASGFVFTSVTGGTASSCLSWYNSQNGVSIIGAVADCHDTTMQSCKFYGNTNCGVIFNTRVMVGLWTFASCAFNSGPASAQAAGMRFPNSVDQVTLEQCTFGNIDAHATGDLDVSVAETLCSIRLLDCLLASTVELASQTNLASGSYISSQRHDNTAGSHKTWARRGTYTIDTTIVESPLTASLRAAPNNASGELHLGTIRRAFRVPVLTGQTVTPTVRVRKSVVGDGTAYNGNQPKLYVKKNIPMGIASDTLLATFATAAGSWGDLGAVATAAVTDTGVLEFYVTCDGTAGWINIGRFSVL